MEEESYASELATMNEEVSPKVRQERIRKRKPNPKCFLSSKKYAELRFGQRSTRFGEEAPRWHDIDKAANKNGKRQLIVLDDGTEYEGEWQDNLRHGQGRHYTGEGYYDGEFIDDMYEGQGEYFLWSDTSNCDIDGAWMLYRGEWYHGKMNGNGTKFEVNGNSYEGEFRRGKRHGQGSMYYQNGDVYTGEWANDVRCGHGELQKQNGDLFVGEYKDDLRNGPGELHIAATKRRLEGTWEDDMFRGGSYYDEVENPRYVQPDDISGTTDGLIPTIKLKDPDGVLREALKPRPKPRN